MRKPRIPSRLLQHLHLHATTVAFFFFFLRRILWSRPALELTREKPCEAHNFS